MMDETMTVGLRERAVLEHTLAVARNADRIGCIRDGGVRFEQSAIDAWIARHRSGGVQQPAVVAERPAARPHQLIAARRGKPNLVTGQTYGRTA